MQATQVKERKTTDFVTFYDYFDPNDLYFLIIILHNFNDLSKLSERTVPHSVSDMTIKSDILHFFKYRKLL